MTSIWLGNGEIAEPAWSAQLFDRERLHLPLAGRPGGRLATDADELTCRFDLGKVLGLDVDARRTHDRASDGNHQFALPISSISDGTSAVRMTTASTKIAAASPRPNSLMIRSPPRMNEPKTTIMMAAAAVIVPPVAASPRRTASAVVAAAQPLLVDPHHEEHLVVHRQPEQDREQHDGQERLDRTRPAHAEQPPSQPHWKTAVTMPNAAAIESRFMIAAFSGTSKLRSTSASSRNENSTTDADEQRAASTVSTGREVGEDRRDPADVHGGARALAAGGMAVPQRVDQVGGRRILRRRARIHREQRDLVPSFAGDRRSAASRPRPRAASDRRCELRHRVASRGTVRLGDHRAAGR